MKKVSQLVVHFEDGDSQTFKFDPPISLKVAKDDKQQTVGYFLNWKNS